MRFSHDGDLLAVVTEDKWVDIVSLLSPELPHRCLRWVWLQVSVETGERLHRFTTVGSPNSVAWNPVKMQLAYTVDEGTPSEGVLRVTGPV